MVLRPCQHSIGYMGDGFYRSEDPTNSIKVLKEKSYKGKPRKHKIHWLQHFSHNTLNKQTAASTIWWCGFGLVVWLSGNALVSINVVTLHRARLVLGWVTMCERVNHLLM